MSHNCTFCNKQFGRKSSLRRHQRGCRLADTIKLLSCSICDYTTPHSYRLKLHKKKHEGEIKRFKKCPLCQANSYGIQIKAHFKTEHGIEMKLHNLEFENFESFQTWRQDIEKKDGVQFTINATYAKKEDGSKTMIFVCFRDGFFRSRAKVRKLKGLGSNKINGHCPARIRITISKNGSVMGEYQEVHVGHKLNDIDRQRLTKTERDNLAEKIRLNIPYEQILTEVQGCVGNQLQRSAIISRKDLHNLARDYHLTPIKKKRVRKRKDSGVNHGIKFPGNKPQKMINALTVTRLRHKAGMKLERRVVEMEENTWVISASADKSKPFEIVQKRFSSCCQTNCPHCEICIHQFQCNCTDYALRFNMCKHIHYLKWKIDQKEVVKQSSPSRDEEGEDDSDGALIIELGDENSAPSTEQLELSYHAEPKDLSKLKQLIEAKVQNVLRGIKSVDSAQKVLKQMIVIEETLDTSVSAEPQRSDHNYCLPQHKNNIANGGIV